MKATLKSLARAIALLIVSPLLLTHFICKSVSSADQSLESHSQLLSLLPGASGSYLRVAFYRWALSYCDPTATIGFGVLFSKAGAELRKRVYIGPRCMLGLVTLEDDVLLGPAVQIPSGPHIHGINCLDTPIREQPGTPVRITIGRDSWIGGGAIILADIQPQTVVGAGSIVTKVLPNQTIVVGNPAKVLRSRV